MRMRLGVALGILVGLTAPALAGPQVRIASGVVEGGSDGGIAAFKGIPFAAPPVGPLRWRAPRPPAPWDGARKAVEFGPICPQPMQSGAQGDIANRLARAEDCLTLNVWSPDLAAAHKLPVMIWIHGGGFQAGGSGFPYLSGAELAAKGIVVVTLNYRLGWLGSFVHPALAAEAPGESSGNLFLLDQIAALEWVRDNIAGFGGDPGNVTILGGSAGGASVNALMAVPSARGLFHKAIAQSGDGLAPLRDRQRAESETLAFAQRQGIHARDAIGLGELRALDPAPFIADQNEYAGFGAFGPVVDGGFMPDAIASAFAKGIAARVPYIAGANSFEASLLPEEYLPVGAIAQGLGEDIADLRALYAANGSPEGQTFVQAFLGDAVFAAPARALAGYVAQTSTPAWLYRFDYIGVALRGRQPGAGHGDEIAYIFGLKWWVREAAKRDPSKIFPVAKKDRAMVETMQAYWTNFAKTGDPNGPPSAGTPRWSRYDSAIDPWLVLDDDVREERGLRKPLLDRIVHAWSKRTGLPAPR